MREGNLRRVVDRLRDLRARKYDAQLVAQKLNLERVPRPDGAKWTAAEVERLVREYGLPALAIHGEGSLLAGVRVMKRPKGTKADLYGPLPDDDDASDN